MNNNSRCYVFYQLLQNQFNFKLEVKSTILLFSINEQKQPLILRERERKYFFQQQQQQQINLVSISISFPFSLSIIDSFSLFENLECFFFIRKVLFEPANKCHMSNFPHLHKKNNKIAFEISFSLDLSPLYIHYCTKNVLACILNRNQKSCG